MPVSILRVADADVMIDLQRQYLPAVTWFFSLPPDTLAVPGYVLMEMYQSARNAREQWATEQFVQGLPVVWASEAECVRAVATFRTLHLSHGIGLVDMLNAATALTLGVPLCTFNVKHYRLVPRLATEQPYVR